MPNDKTAVISGGGPCGLAAALMLHQRGWGRIVVLERNPSAVSFDKNKGFNYLIDARGQKLLTQLGLADRLQSYGVENQRNIMRLVGPDGAQKTFKSPFFDPRRDAAFWIRRDRFQAMLFDRIMELDDDRIDLLFGWRFEGVELSSSGPPTIVGVSEGGEERRDFNADLLLGCDGLRSSVRTAMASDSGAPAKAFDQVRHPSPASQLYYKVLQMPARIPLKGDLPPADDHRMAYTFLARHREPDKAMAMVGYPVANPSEPRTMNIIRLEGHAIWRIKTTSELFEFLEDAFPQLPIRGVLTDEEAEDFVATPPPKFPAPQYTRTIHAVFSSQGGSLPALLLGDAAHAFPPDLGLGVNCALEDVHHLNRHLDMAGGDPEAASRAFDKEQAPERAALVRLVQTVAPYQYNQRPWSTRIWALQFFAVEALHRLVPVWIDRSQVLLAQRDELRFTEIRRRQILNRWKVGALLLAPVAALWGVMAAF